MHVTFEVAGRTLRLVSIKNGCYTQSWIDQDSGLVYLFVNTVGQGRPIDDRFFDLSKQAIAQFSSPHLPRLKQILYDGFVTRHGEHTTRFYAREVYETIWYDPLVAASGEPWVQYKTLRRLENEAERAFEAMSDKMMVDLNNNFLDAVRGHRYLPESLQDAVYQAVTALADCGPDYRIEVKKANFGTGPDGQLVWLDPGWDTRHKVARRRRK